MQKLTVRASKLYFTQLLITELDLASPARVVKLHMAIILQFFVYAYIGMDMLEN